MNKRASNGGWGVLVVQAIVLAGLIMIGLLSTPAGIAGEYEKTYGEYVTSVNSYNDLREQYSNTLNACLSTPDQCKAILEKEKSTIPTTDLVATEKANIPAWRFYSGVVLIFLFGITSLVISAMQISRSNKERREREKQFEVEKKRETQRALEDGRRETIRSLALELVSDKDVISELTVWLNEYRSGEAEIDQSAYLHNQILTRLVKQIHLNPITKIDEIVRFNPQQHRTFDLLQENDEAIVVEPGWRVGRDVIKPPLVRRK